MAHNVCLLPCIGTAAIVLTTYGSGNRLCRCSQPFPGDLVFTIFGANLEQWPLPSWPDAVKALPKSLLDKRWEESQ